MKAKADRMREEYDAPGNVEDETMITDAPGAVEGERPLNAQEVDALKEFVSSSYLSGYAKGSKTAKIEILQTVYGQAYLSGYLTAK